MIKALWKRQNNGTHNSPLLFAGYDKNGDGTVTIAEFTAVMKKVGRMCDDQIVNMLKKADKDGDGWFINQYLLLSWIFFF